MTPFYFTPLQELLSCLTSTMSVLYTVLSNTTERSCNELLVLVNKIIGEGLNLFESVSDSPVHLLKDLQGKFISVLQILWSKETAEQSITEKSMPFFTATLEKLLSWGQFMVDTVLLSWSRAVNKFVNDIPTSTNLPVSTNQIMKDILQTSTMSSSRKHTMEHTIGMVLNRSSALPCNNGKVSAILGLCTLIGKWI